MRRYFVIFAGILLIALTSGVAQAVEYGGLGGRPANPDPKNARSISIFIFSLAGGESKRDAVRVVNNSSEAKTVEVYATDSELASGGSFACTQKADTQSKVGSWIKFEKSQITLPANSNEIVGFTVTVPNGVDVGEHNGCVVIQEKGKVTEAEGNGVALSFRSAIRTVVTVPGDIVKQVSFTNLTAQGMKKQYILKAELKNDGNVSLDTNVKVAVQNVFGQKVYENGGVYPILSQEQPVELNFEYKRPFWGGLYRLAGTAAYNSDPNSTLGASTATDTVIKSPSSTLYIAPHPLAWLVYILALVLVLALAKLVYNRKVKQRRVSRAWETFIVEKGDTINALAKEHRTSWKTIATVNKLKPPYELRPGSTIKLPRIGKSAGKK